MEGQTTPNWMNSVVSRTKREHMKEQWMDRVVPDLKDGLSKKEKPRMDGWMREGCG